MFKLKNIFNYINEAKVEQGRGPFYEYTDNHRTIEMVFNEGIKKYKSKIERAKFVNTGYPEILFKIKGGSEYLLSYRPGRVFTEDSDAGAIRLVTSGYDDRRGYLLRKSLVKIWEVNANRAGRKFGDIGLSKDDFKESIKKLSDWMKSI